MSGVLLGAVLLVAAGCGKEGRLAVVDAWARPTPVVADTSAFYVTLSNGGSEAVIAGARSPVCEATALHDSVLEEGLMEMRQVDSITVLSHTELVMEPGGLHIMCLGLTEPLVEADEVALTLQLEDGSALEVPVSVENR